MGDRGFHVVTAEGRTLHHPDTGAVLRCWPDGKSLEIFHLGLRNPQELCWDDLGTPFTGDNNCDSGDQARLVHVLDGAESGWCQDVQSLPSRGPWNREHLWELSADFPGLERPSWCLSPIEHVGAGPSGFEAYPGIGGGAELAGRLLLVDFRGSESLVHALLPQADGAAFKLAEDEVFYQGATVTDLVFGFDGRLYLSDWGGGWSPNPNGNVFTLAPDEARLSPAEREQLRAVQLLCQGQVRERSAAQLVELLQHADRRARLAAQYELMRRGPGGALGAEEALTGAALLRASNSADRPLVARLHALWAAAFWARSDSSWCDFLLTGLRAAEPWERARAAEALGGLWDAETLSQAQRLAKPALLEALKDRDARVVYHAAQAIGRLHLSEAREALLQAAERCRADFAETLGAGSASLVKTSDSTAAADSLSSDSPQSQAVVRHGIVTALERLGLGPADLAGVEQRGPSARLALTIALGRLGSPLIAAFLNDPEPRVAVEALRLVYDRAFRTPELRELWPQLAERLDAPLPANWPAEPVLRRAIEAAQHLGGSDQAERLLAFASRADTAPEWRRLALERLGEFARPQPREGVWGHLVEPPERSAAALSPLIEAQSSALLAACAGDSAAETLARTLLVRYGPPRSADELLAGLGRLSEPPAARLVMLEQLLSLAPDQTVTAAERVLSRLPMAGDELLRQRALESLAAADPARAEGLAQQQLFAARDGDRQSALWTLASLATPSAIATLRALDRETRAGRGDPALSLELLLAREALGARWTGASAVAAGNGGLQGLQAGASGAPQVAPGATDAHGAIAAGGVEHGQSDSAQQEHVTAASEGDGATGSGLDEGPADDAASTAANALAAGVAGPWPTAEEVRTNLERLAKQPRSLPVETLLVGGVAERGRELFLHHGAAECLRCHQVAGQGGIVGPALDGIGSRLSPAALAESLLTPDARIAPGYSAPSAMPRMDTLVRPGELRDLVAFLGSLKSPSPAAATRTNLGQSTSAAKHEGATSSASLASLAPSGSPGANQQNERIVGASSQSSDHGDAGQGSAAHPEHGSGPAPLQVFALTAAAAALVIGATLLLGRRSA
jgi:quinoprotein glucose dehydrogenase